MRRWIGMMAVCTGIVACCWPGWGNRASAETPESADGLFAPSPITEGMAVGIVLEACGGIEGLRWYNNDSLASIPSIMVYEAMSNEEMECGSLLFEGLAVAGVNDGWSEVMFNGTIRSETGYVCVVMMLPEGMPFVARGEGGGFAFGYVKASRGGSGYIVRNGVVVAKLIGCPAVELIVSETNKAVGDRDWLKKTETRPGRFFVETWPNPAWNGTELHYALPRGEEHELSIYDLRGRLVKRVVNGQAEAGTYTRRWDGRNEEGAPVSAGIYFARLRIGKEVISHRMVVMK